MADEHAVQFPPPWSSAQLTPEQESVLRGERGHILKATEQVRGGEKPMEELAGALERYASNLRPTKKRGKNAVAADLREAARRLREMDGERIEGSVYDAHPIGDVYVFKVRSMAKQPGQRPATLILHKPQEQSDV